MRWDIGAMVAATIAVIGAATSYGQNQQTNKDQDRRIESLEEKSEDMNDLATGLAVQNTKIDAQTRALRDLSEAVRDIGRKLEDSQ